MRYHLYLSEAKVNMLYPQIVRSSRSAGGEVGFDLKLIKVSRRTDSTREPSVYEKLAAVEEWIYAREPVGTVEEPDAWIYGRMTLMATILKLEGSKSQSDLSDGPVLFVDSNHSPHILMGGSVQHLVGTDPYPSLSLPSKVRFYSHPVTLGLTLSRYADELGLLEGPDREHGVHDTDIEALDNEWEVLSGLARRVVNGVTPSDYGPQSRRAHPTSRYVGSCEFLAKRIRTVGRFGDIAPGFLASQQTYVTLASPLFVALLD